jgi:hypothetical protein
VPCGAHLAVVTKGGLGRCQQHPEVFRRGDQNRKLRSRFYQLRYRIIVSRNAVWLSQVTQHIMWLRDISSLSTVEFLAISERSAYLIYKIMSDLITPHSLLQESQQISVHLWKTQNTGQRRHHYCIKCECIRIRATCSSVCSAVYLAVTEYSAGRWLIQTSW